MHVPEAAVKIGACRFSFIDLCEKPLGAADYLAIAEAFPIVFVSDIPLLDAGRLNQLRRFITFVDCMYDRGVRVRCFMKLWYQCPSVGLMFTHVSFVFASYIASQPKVLSVFIKSTLA